MPHSQHNISFRKIRPGDVANLVRWLREPEVARWYWDSNRKSEQELADKWNARAAEDDGDTDRYIIVVDGEVIGEIQLSEVSKFPEAAAAITIPDSVSVDLFIGDPEWRNRGIGTAVIRKFIREFVFTRPGIKTCIIDPEPENLRAIRSYEKAGFQYVRTYHSNEDDVDVYLMRMDTPPAD